MFVSRLRWTCLAALVVAACSDSTTGPDSSVITCDRDEACPYGQYCDEGVCKDVVNKCGDGGSCPDGFTCRHGACVPVESDGDAGTDADGEGDGGDSGADLGPQPDVFVQSPAGSGEPPVYQLNFGNVLVGQTVSGEIILGNRGTADLRILQLNFEMGPGAADFSLPPEIVSSLPIVVTPGAQATIGVNYRASDGLTDNAILDIISNDPDEPLLKIHLLSEFKGEPGATVSPLALQFGDVPVGEASQPLSFLISNQGSGNAVLTLQDVRMEIPANPDFSVAVQDANGDPVTFPALVNRGDALTARVVFHPTIKQALSDNVVVISDDPDPADQQLKVAVSGNGVTGDLSVQPSPADLGRVRVGRHGELTLVISNAGGADFSLTGLALVGLSQDWSLSSADLDIANLGTNPHLLQPTQSVTILLGFDPRDAGLQEGHLEISNTSPEPLRQVMVRATGYIPPRVRTIPDPASLVFGNVQFDMLTGQRETKELELAIENIGGEPLHLTQIQRSSSTSSEYTFRPASVPPVDVGEQTSLRIAFAPQNDGPKLGALLVDTDDPDLSLEGVVGRFQIDMSATGIDPTIFVSPASQIVFGNAYLGRLVSADVTIRNAGLGPLVLNEILLTPGSASEFSLDNLPALPMVIANPMVEVKFQARFRPLNLAGFSGALAIRSSDLGNPEVVLNLSGTGVGCPAGRIDCNGDPQDECETPCVPTGVEVCDLRDNDCDCDTDEDFDLNTDINNCGVCGRVCSFPHAQAACQNRVCVLLTCLEGWSDCDNDQVTGCETHTSVDVNNCGQCDQVCQFAHASASCLAGQCVMGSCENGYANCNSGTTDGCETSIWNNVDNCGSCGLRCQFQNAVARCLGTTCDLDYCLPGFANCNFQDGDGCEVNLLTDPNNCQTCNHVCPSSGGTPVCNSGICGISSCNPGWADCDHDGVSCETQTSADVNNCGACGNMCSLDHATARCVNSTCEVDTCANGWGNCDSQHPNGCERNLTNDPAYCGFCDNQCSFAHATPLCQASTCTLGPCDPGYYNADGNPTNGCECHADTVSDVCDDALITDLGILTSGQTRQASGNLIPILDEDWYTFTAPDNHTADGTSGTDFYHVRITFDPGSGNPDGEFAFEIYRSPNPGAGCAAKGSPVCSMPDTTYDYYALTPPQTQCRTSGATTSPGPPLCRDDSSRYWIRVYRVATQVTCSSYILNISFTQ
ncbi:MAG: choice-of-anchor D domain-containing protein [Myxococcales bacterium]|nr:choice-of-anchor D domain-containing protein [Myxococcales bacterium]